MRAAQLDRAARNADPVAFGQPDHRQVGIRVRELLEALVPGLAVMARQRHADVVRVDLERQQPERLEATRVDDRHVVGGPDRRARQVGACTPAKIFGLPSGNPGTYYLNKGTLAAFLQELERIAAANDDQFAFFDIGWMPGEL